MFETGVGKAAGCVLDVYLWAVIFFFKKKGYPSSAPRSGTDGWQVLGLGPLDDEVPIPSHVQESKYYYRAAKDW